VCVNLQWKRASEKKTPGQGAGLHGKISNNIYGLAGRAHDHFNALMLRWIELYSISMLAASTEKEAEDIEKLLIRELNPNYNSPPGRSRFQELYG
jgi:hypothetical protein